MMPEFLVQVITQTVQPTPLPAPVPPILDLSNGIWQGIGALFGLAAIIVSLVFWWTARQRKQLSYQVVSDTPLVSVREEAELKGRLKVLFDDVPAQDLDLRAVIVRVFNSGNVAIGEDDYFGHPIELQFGENAEVLTASVIKTGPDDFVAKATPAGTKALIHPVLLNKGQSLEVKTLVKQKRGFRFYAHIRDVQVRRFDESSTNSQSIRAQMAFIIAAVIASVSYLMIVLSGNTSLFVIGLMGLELMAVVILGSRTITSSTRN
jgi:uncharacterized membrane protein